MSLCIIPARGGSKRIPGKNIKLFAGKPIIAYSIEAAKASECFDNIIVSTDDAEIAEVAKAHGAEVPFRRPKELSDDFTTTIAVVNHAIKWFEDHQSKPEYVCCLYATAPFVNSNALQSSLKHLKKENAEYCFTVTSFPFPIQRAIQITKEQRVEMFFPEYLNTRSQDLTQAYHDAGQFYWGKADALLDGKPLFSNFAVPYILPSYLVQDIDTPEDWVRAELLFRLIKESPSYDI
jgi:pseudaminic acid cytidylyltransferase